MKTRSIPRLRRCACPLAAPALAVALALGLSACGGGGSGGFTPQAQSQTDRRVLPQDFLTSTSVNYSPYRTSRNESQLTSEVITPQNVLQDLRLIEAAGIGNIRLFSSRAFAGTVLEVIRANNLKLKVQLGAYPNPVAANDADREPKPADPVAEADNQAELDRAIVLANQYKDIVAAVSVGNEVMVEWSTHKIHPERMAGYLRKVRAAITQPITTNDNFLFWSKVPNEIAAVIDYAAVHVYPLLDTFYNPTAYDWRQKNVPQAQRAHAMLDASVAEAKRQFSLARAALDKLNLTDMPMVIGETGWSAVDTTGGPNLAYRAHPVNQRMYFDALQTWVREGRSDRHGPKAIFYFQAFDEPWKQGDDGWGLFNANREARYVVQGLGTCGVAWTCEAGTWTLADALRWVAPVVAPAVGASRYTLYADATVAGESRPAGLRWDPFANTAYRDAPAAGAPDGGAAFEITPNPVDYGWGLFQRAGDDSTENLSAFANGHVRFSVRSDGYPGKIEIGISTDTDDRDIQEAYLQIAPGEYGYCNTNTWCDVVIPVSAFVAANPKLDLRLVNFRFIIADRFEKTGKPLNLTGLPNIRIDGLHWSP
jgi:exo-beta-1,3-glucanase (GH17 family)